MDFKDFEPHQSAGVANYSQGCLFQTRPGLFRVQYMYTINMDATLNGCCEPAVMRRYARGLYFKMRKTNMNLITVLLIQAEHIESHDNMLQISWNNLHCTAIVCTINEAREYHKCCSLLSAMATNHKLTYVQCKLLYFAAWLLHTNTNRNNNNTKKRNIQKIKTCNNKCIKKETAKENQCSNDSLVRSYQI